MLRATTLGLLLTAACFASAQLRTIEAVTFAATPGKIYVPVREAAQALGWRMDHDAVVDLTTVNAKPLDVNLPSLGDGTHLVSIDVLREWGARFDGKRVSAGGAGFNVSIGEKRVLVDIGNQTLRAWQGKRLVFASSVSSGRDGKGTPTGSFKALTREPNHRSAIYGSPMPWSVQLVGNIFIHGSNSFYDTIGSHGCIRLPLTNGDRAKWFFDWVDIGTPVKVFGVKPQKS